MDELKNTNDIDFLKGYLKDVYTIEKERYVSLQSKMKISNIIAGLGIKNAKTGEAERKELEWNEKYSNIETYASIFFVGLDDFKTPVACIILWIVLAVFHVPYSFLWAFIAYIVLGALMVNTYINEIKRSNEELRAKKDAAFMEEDLRIKNELQQAQQYRQKANLFNEVISESETALDKLYNLNIIFPKYRNLPAIAQIYEYFEAGRVTELSGPNGAYNLYESELRQNIIISRLDVVISQLNQVMNNQYMLYSVIQESNWMLNNIEDRTAIAEYNSTTIARNSELILKYIED